MMSVYSSMNIGLLFGFWTLLPRNHSTGTALHRSNCGLAIAESQMFHGKVVQSPRGFAQVWMTSSCILHECYSILSIAVRGTNSCSAVTSFATRWTEPPP
jgi:hypothetical protein